MPTLKVALLQLLSAGFNGQANLETGEAACRTAAGMGADIALFPEMWNTGYSFFDRHLPGSRDAWAAGAIGPEDDFYHHFADLAAELRMAIGLTYLERWPGKPRNSLTLFDRMGKPVLNYAKVHTCEFDAEAALTPGDGFFTCSLDSAAGVVQVGAMICFDREFPESARILMLQGAEVILVPNACTMETHRLGQLRARAFENMTGIALANYAAPQENGHSVAYDGMAYDRDGNSRETCLVEAGEAAGVYLAEFDLDALRYYRSHEVWGNAYRRPRLYHQLVDEKIQPPFWRADATR